MKYVYKKQYVYMMKYTTAAKIITAIMMGEQPKPEPECVGGAFYPNGNDKDVEYIKKHNIELTPLEVFRRNENQQINTLDYLSSYMPKMQVVKLDGPAYATTASVVSLNNNPREKGLIGKWTEDLDKNAKIYYYVMDDLVLPMFVVMNDRIGLNTKFNDVLYIVKLNGMMTDCMPEEGDVIFSSEKEAEDYINNKKKNKHLQKKDKIINIHKKYQDKRFI